MSRLTRNQEKYWGKGNYKGEKYIIGSDGVTSKQMCLNKLGKLEDLEEELGCPLEVVVKALKYGVYVLDEETCGTKWILRGFVNHTQDYVIGAFGFVDDRDWAKIKDEETGLDIPIFYAWKDYKKTWWLKEDKSE